MAETYKDYTTIQRVLDEQGYIILCSADPTLGKVAPSTGYVIEGEHVVHHHGGRCKGAKMVCIGEATLEEWLEQTSKFFPKYDNSCRPDAIFIKVVAE